MTREDRSGHDGRHPASAAAREPPTVDAGTLLGAAREVLIVHKGERYRLRLTQNDKLILTK
jgi:hemin uptake protein HemP